MRLPRTLAALTVWLLAVESAFVALVAWFGYAGTGDGLSDLALPGGLTLVSLGAAWACGRLVAPSLRDFALPAGGTLLVAQVVGLVWLLSQVGC